MNEKMKWSSIVWSVQHMCDEWRCVVVWYGGKRGGTHGHYKIIKEWQFVTGRCVLYGFYRAIISTLLVAWVVIINICPLHIHVSLSLSLSLTHTYTHAHNVVQVTYSIPISVYQPVGRLVFLPTDASLTARKLTTGKMNAHHSNWPGVGHTVCTYVRTYIKSRANTRTDQKHNADEWICPFRVPITPFA